MPKTADILNDAWMGVKDAKDALANVVTATADGPLWPLAREVYGETERLLGRVDELEDLAEKHAA